MLKAIGYSDAFVLVLVLAESLLIAVLGGGAGPVAREGDHASGDPTGGMHPLYYPTACAALVGALVAWRSGAGGA